MASAFGGDHIPQPQGQANLACFYLCCVIVTHDGNIWKNIMTELVGSKTKVKQPMLNFWRLIDYKLKDTDEHASRRV